MGRKNRTNYSRKYNPEVKEETVEEVVEIEDEFEDLNDEPVVEEEPTAKIVRVHIPTDQKLNVRSEASTDSEVLTELSNNTEVEILDDTFANWLKIVTPFGIEGFVKTDYVELI